MPKQYCPSCGAGTEYSLTAPKFCSSCGGGFSVISPALANSSSAASQPRPVARKRPVVVIEDEDGEEYDYEDEESVRIKIPKKLSFTVDPIPTLQKVAASSLGPPVPGEIQYQRGPALDKLERKQRASQVINKLRTVERHGFGGEE